MQKDILTKLLNLSRVAGGSVVFMPMESKAKGLMTTAEIEYTPKEMGILMHIAEENNIRVSFVPFKANKGRIGYRHNELRIGIRMGMTFDEYIYTLAHELAHYFLHYDKGDTIESEKHEEYEEQADRAAKMLLAALNIDQKGGAA